MGEVGIIDVDPARNVFRPHGVRRTDRSQAGRTTLHDSASGKPGAVQSAN